MAIAATILVVLLLGSTVYLWRRERIAALERDRGIRLAADIDDRYTQSLGTLTEAYEGLMDACGSSVLIVNSNHIIKQANKTACRLFGADIEQLIDKPLISATFSKPLEDHLKEQFRRQERQPRRLRIDVPGGRTVRVSIRRLPSLDGAGEGALLVFRDETQLRRLETVRQDFVANVSHELRTPLASIRAIAEALEGGGLEDRETTQQFLETIIRETDRLTRIANDLLTLAGAESEAPERQEFDLSQLAADVSKRFVSTAKSVQIALSADIEPDLLATASRYQMEQVLVNLLDNAIKYTSPGGSVHVQLEATPRGATLTVSDTGIGIMEEHLPRIFERFYRVDKARSRESGGTGLGLAIVKHLVEANGGTVSVESEFNRGTSFRVELPVAEGNRS